MSLISINPATEEETGRFEEASSEAISQLLDQAVAQQSKWRQESFETRAKLLTQLASALDDSKDHLAQLATKEMGKLYAEAVGEVEKCAWVCRYYAEHGKSFLNDETLDDDDNKRSFIAYEPLGVVLAVMPWNFPFWQVFRCAVPAIMAGNAVVLKHASNVTGCALAIEDIFRQCKAAPGLFTTIVLSGSKTSALLDDGRIAAASVTGSEKAGSCVAEAAGRNIKPTVLELGGSDAFVVLDRVDDEVIGHAVKSRFQNCGQSCIAAKRFIVLDAVFDEFCERFTGAARELAIGSPNDPATGLAPMARADLREDLHALVEDARSKGATILTGGQLATGSGYYYPATVITDIAENSRLYSEEAFGPVASVYRATDEDHAVRLANDSEFGLGGSVFANDVDRGIAVARRIDSGAVYVNRMMASDPRLPFGGIKRSGYGRELSRAGILEFVNRKTISAQLRD